VNGIRYGAARFGGSICFAPAARQHASLPHLLIPLSGSQQEDLVNFLDTL
jgi:hypothetical protein